jgi:anaerobic dimethyl sulfoxide reductase subunit B (iron-sulfur subunit)
MRRAFVFDQEKCMGCNTCTVACKDYNQVNPGPVRWRKQHTHEVDDNFFPLSMGCNHCKEPACLKACAVGAIIKRPDDGVVYVDRDKCINLLQCISACPFAEPAIAEDAQEPTRYKGWQVNHPMQKCDFCMDRLDKGLQPICVASCAAFALEVGDYDTLIAKYAAKGVTLTQMSRAEFPYAYANSDDSTQPSYLVNKRGGLTIIKAVEAE